MLKLPQAVRGSVPEMRMRENMKKGGRFIAGLTSEALLISQYEGEKGSLQPIQRTSATVPVAEGDRVIVSMTTVSTHKVSKAALVEIEFSDQNGSPVDFVWNSSPSNFGAFQYIDVQEPGEHATTQFALDAPAGAATLKILGHNWNRYVRTRVVGEIRVQNLNVPQKTQSISEQTTYPAINLLIKRPVPGKASSVRISVDHSAAGEQSANPVVVKWRDEYGTELMPPCDLAQHPKHGAYFVLKGQQNSVENTTIEIDIPKSVAQIEIQGLNWGAKSALIHGVPVLEFVEDPLAQIEEFLQEIPSGDKLYIIDTTAPPLGHPTLSLRPNNLSTQYERLCIWVIFLPFGSLQEFQARVSEKTLQVPRQQFQALIELVSENRTPAESVFVCSSFPNFQSVTACTLLKSKGWTIIYECRDDMEEFNRVGYSKWYSQDLERYMLDIADRVVAVSPALLEKLRVMTPRGFDGIVIPNGVNDRTIASGASLREKNALSIRNSHRVVGYVGHLTPSWFDWELVVYAAQQLPDVLFQIVGHGMPDNLSLPTNVEFLGPKTHEELLEIVPFWRVGLIPFKDLPLTRSVDPNKIYEYFAWGMRCVSSKMGSVETYPSTWVYSGRVEFVNSLQAALASSISVEELEGIEKFVSRVSWFDRAREMMNYIGDDGMYPEKKCDEGVSRA